MNRIVNVARIHLLDRWTFIYTPILVFLGLFVFSYIITISLSHAVSPGDGPIVTGTFQGLLWALLAVSISSVSRSFPLAIALSNTRRTYVLGSALLFIAYSAVAALISTITARIEIATDGFWVDMWLLNIPFVTEGAIFTQFLAFFALFAFFFSTGFWIGALYKRFGLWGLFVFAAIAIVIIAAWVVTMGLSDSWPGVGDWFRALTPLKISSILLAVVALESVTVWGLLRTAKP